MYNKTKNTLITYPIGKTGAFNIPNGVTTIGENSFSGCTSLTSITIPNSVISIEYWAFRNCDRLASVTIPDSVAIIGYRAFDNCTSLTSVTFARGSNITNNNFGNEVFPERSEGNGGDTLKTAYATGKAGTYTRAANDNTWTKQ